MVNSETEAGLSGKRESFVTAGGVEVARSARPDHYKTAISGYFDKLDTRRGAVPDAAFAEAFAPGVGPLAGYIERLLQNGDGSRPARLAALALYARAASLFAG